MLNKKILKAFTLLELIVVIVVLGILAMLAVPTFNTVKEKSADSVANKNASAVQRDFNAQAALAQSDSSITPTASGAWVINGTSYSYTATAGNTGQNVVASKANGGSGGNPTGAVTYYGGTDYDQMGFYSGGSGSAAANTKSGINTGVSNSTLVSTILGMSNINMVLTDGVNSATWTAEPQVNQAILVFNPNFSSINWSQWSSFTSFSDFAGSIDINTSTNTITFHIYS